MDTIQSQRIIGSLRNGIPPDRSVRAYTVGRKSEIADLTQRLCDPDGTVLLLKANYGSGKTHLLRYIREEALDQGYVVSTVTLDSSSAVRFNRMDQVFGAVCRNLEVPQEAGKKGIRPFFDTLVNSINQRGDEWYDITHKWRWDYSEKLDSPAIFVALRAWATGTVEACDTVEDWLYQPWLYKTQRKKLYIELVENLRRIFRDPRSDRQFYANGVFTFDVQDYEQSWSALRDFDLLARTSGLKGLIILFDEYEDVITNLKNVSYQEAAFWNLFRFYSGKSFPGKTFYAVTPGFVEKCKQQLLRKGRWDFDFSRFDALPTYEMSPLSNEQLEELSMRILQTHGAAYQWEPDLVMKTSHLNSIVREAAAVQMQDRVRFVITSVVKALDGLLDE